MFKKVLVLFQLFFVDVDFDNRALLFAAAGVFHADQALERLFGKVDNRVLRIPGQNFRIRVKRYGKFEAVSDAGFVNRIFRAVHSVFGSFAGGMGIAFFFADGISGFAGAVENFVGLAATRCLGRHRAVLTHLESFAGSRFYIGFRNAAAGGAGFSGGNVSGRNLFQDMGEVFAFSAADAVIF